MTKKIVVRLEKTDGTFIANSQVITLHGIGTGPILATDFLDGVLTGTVTTSARAAGVVKRLVPPPPPPLPSLTPTPTPTSSPGNSPTPTPTPSPSVPAVPVPTITYPLTSTHGVPFSWSISGGQPYDTWFASTTGDFVRRYPASGGAPLNASGAVSYTDGDWYPNFGNITVNFQFTSGTKISKPHQVIPNAPIVNYPTTSTHGTPFSYTITNGIPRSNWYVTTSGAFETRYPASGTVQLDNTGGASFTDGDWYPNYGVIDVTFHFVGNITVTKPMTISVRPPTIEYPTTSTNGIPFNWKIENGIPYDDWYVETSGDFVVRYPTTGTLKLDANGKHFSYTGDWSPNHGTITLTFYFASGVTVTKNMVVSPALVLVPGLCKKVYSGMPTSSNDWSSYNVGFFTNTSPTSTAPDTGTALSPDTSNMTSTQWTGYFVPTSTSTWTFRATGVDDWFIMWIGPAADSPNAGDIAFTGNWFIRQKYGEPAMMPGAMFNLGFKYKIRIQYSNFSGPGGFNLQYSINSGASWNSDISTIFKYDTCV